MRFRYTVLVLLTSSYLAGMLIGLQQTYTINSPIEKEEGCVSLVDKISAMNRYDRFVHIAKNNLTVSIKTMIFGIFSLGCFSVIYIFYNGLYSGMIIDDCLKYLSISELLKVTLPHSIEIIGLVLFGYIGYILSAKILLDKMDYTYLKVLLLFVVALIIIILAAFIESYISIS